MIYIGEMGTLAVCLVFYLSKHFEQRMPKQQRQVMYVGPYLDDYVVVVNDSVPFYILCSLLTLVQLGSQPSNKISRGRFQVEGAHQILCLPTTTTDTFDTLPTNTMPKIVSSSIVSSSDHLVQQEDQRSALHVYYCLCSEFILVIDADLRILPRRRTDNAIIVSNTKRTYKLTAEPGQTVVVQR